MLWGERERERERDWEETASYEKQNFDKLLKENFNIFSLKNIQAIDILYMLYRYIYNMLINWFKKGHDVRCNTKSLIHTHVEDEKLFIF